MRIALNLLFLIPGVVGGTQTYATGLMRGLAEIDTENEYFVFLNREAADLELPQAANFRRIVCPVRATRRERRYAWEQGRLPWQLRACRADLVHSLGYVGPLFAPCPQVVTIHDMNYLAVPEEVASVRQKALQLLVAQTARRSAHIVAVSEFSQREIERYLGIASDRITVTHEGPRDLTASAEPWSALAERYGLERPYLIAFSSPFLHKNIPRLIEAFARLRAEVPHDLALVGHAPEGQNLHAEIAKRGVTERVRVTGYVPEAHVMPLLAHADLFVFPSWYEGFGLPILDAQRAGVAVASSTAASLPEVAGDGALYFDPTSVEEMTQTLRRALLDAALRECLVAKGRANLSRFSWQKTAQKTLEVYTRFAAK
jgi:glycosyltransferase involved in cell wall biosynthesis